MYILWGCKDFDQWTFCFPLIVSDQCVKLDVISLPSSRLNPNMNNKLMKMLLFLQIQSHSHWNSALKESESTKQRLATKCANTNNGPPGAVGMFQSGWRWSNSFLLCFMCSLCISLCDLREPGGEGGAHSCCTVCARSVVCTREVAGWTLVKHPGSSRRPRTQSSSPEERRTNDDDLKAKSPTASFQRSDESTISTLLLAPSLVSSPLF